MPDLPTPLVEVVNRLLTRMDELVPAALYPDQVIRTPPDRIPGTAFFPGGSGLYLEDRDPGAAEFPFRGVMVLGHNFDSEAGFQRSLEQGKEKLTSGTWRSLIGLLRAADVPLEACFFTNAFMGLCEGSNSFDYRGRDDQQFRAACLELLVAQIELQRPRLIVTLGLHVPPLLASISPGLSAWSSPQLRLKDIDKEPIFFRVGIKLHNGLAHEANVVAIAHPSLPNSGKRKPLGFSKGKAGELELVRTGWNRSVSLGR